MHEVLHAVIDQFHLAEHLDGIEEEDFVHVLAAAVVATIDRTRWDEGGKLLLPRFDHD